MARAVDRAAALRRRLALLWALSVGALALHNAEEWLFGLTCWIAAVRDGSGAAVAGLTVSVPRARFRALLDAGLVAELLRSRAELETDLRGFVAATW